MVKSVVTYVAQDINTEFQSTVLQSLHEGDHILLNEDPVRPFCFIRQGRDVARREKKLVD